MEWDPGPDFTNVVCGCLSRLYACYRYYYHFYVCVLALIIGIYSLIYHLVSLRMFIAAFLVKNLIK